MFSLSHELLVFRSVIIRYSIIFFVVFVGLLALPIDGPSYATGAFLSAKVSLVPDGIPVVALGPVSSFVAPIMMAFLIALLATFPLGLWFVVRFLRPALKRNERRVLSVYVFPAIILFYVGCALAYFVIIPATFSILYSFSDPIGVVPMFSLDAFVSSVFFLTASVGFVFLLPVFMAVSSRIGLISGEFWFRHWRLAILSAVVFSAVITPDGSGVTMALLSAPLLGLYAIGAIASVKRA